MVATLDDLKVINFPRYANDEASLEVFAENDLVPFPIRRVFTVHARNDVKRGQHAHIKCKQLLICTFGICKVRCDDGANEQTFILNNPNRGLLIPPYIWAEQLYQTNPTLLIVLCDNFYEDSDYMRSYSNFLAKRQEVVA